MKKVLLITVGVLIAATGVWWGSRLVLNHIYQSIKEFHTDKLTVSQPAVTQTDCQINGHDCWEVIQLLKETEPVYSTSPETEMYSPDIESFKNSALETKGFSVGYYNKHIDGGITASVLWGESDFVNIGTHYTDAGPNLLLIWSDGSQKEFNPQGKLVQ